MDNGLRRRHPPHIPVEERQEQRYDFRVTRRAVFTVLCFFAAGWAHAADLPKGMSIAPSHPLYYVTRDAYIRELPDNNAARIGQITKGQHLSVAGKVVVPKSKGPNWLALKRADGTYGYVFGAALLPMIDGTLKAPLQGKLAAPERPECRYIVSYEGRTRVADDIQQTADYDIAFECEGKSDTPLTFNAGMFITELPFEEQREIYQINIDLWDMRVNDEDALSVTALYDPSAQKVTFDRVNDDRLGNGKDVAAEPASDVPAALAGALKIAHRVWQDGVWDQLAQAAKSDTDGDATRQRDQPAPLPDDTIIDD